MEEKSTWQPELIERSTIETAFSFVEGYSRPDWKRISQIIQKRTAGEHDLHLAWTEAAKHWLDQLRSDLGGGYRVNESRRFLLLAALESEGSGSMLDFVERTLSQIHARLGDSSWTSGYGKHVIVLFEEQDDYYQYISCLYRDGNHPLSGGCLISEGYAHIVAPYDPAHVWPMLAHELAHNCVVNLPLPLWLNEGLAQMIERDVATRPQPLLNHELKERHLTFWDEQNIQGFWAGTSFGEPGESNELSYSLAEIILALLMEKNGDHATFVKQANWADAGQTAVIECLDTDLGEVLSTFLGEGNWRPVRKAMVKSWEAAGAAKPAS